MVILTEARPADPDAAGPNALSPRRLRGGARRSRAATLAGLSPHRSQRARNRGVIPPRGRARACATRFGFGLSTVSLGRAGTDPRGPAPVGTARAHGSGSATAQSHSIAPHAHRGSRRGPRATGGTTALALLLRTRDAPGQKCRLARRPNTTHRWKIDRTPPLPGREPDGTGVETWRHCRGSRARACE